MIDPVLFEINLGSVRLAVHWYGVLIVVSILVGQWIAGREARRRGENPDYLWDGLIWAIPAGIVGARLWYVINDIMSGSKTYTSDPLRILNITEGGLHFYGAILFAAAAFYLYARRHKLDMRLLLDSAAPSLLIGQGIARIANYINQELYGPPTNLPWGIPIDGLHRIPPWNDLSRFPEATTRFHPTFAYEMIWDLAAGGLLLWLARRLERLKPGSVFAAWLILAGVGRVVIEAWRPDQPQIPGTGISYSQIVAALMVLVGSLLLAARHGAIRAPFINLGPDEYRIAPAPAEQSAESPSSRG